MGLERFQAEARSCNAKVLVGPWSERLVEASLQTLYARSLSADRPKFCADFFVGRGGDDVDAGRRVGRGVDHLVAIALSDKGPGLASVNRHESPCLFGGKERPQSPRILQKYRHVVDYRKEESHWGVRGTKSPGGPGQSPASLKSHAHKHGHM